MNVVLRITHLEGTRPPAFLKIEGNLVGGSSALLERECEDLLHAGGLAGIDLTDVPLVDRAGVEALRRLSRAGVEIHCRPGAVASVLEGEGVLIRRTGDGDTDDCA